MQNATRRWKRRHYRLNKWGNALAVSLAWVSGTGVLAVLFFYLIKWLAKA